MSGFLLCSCDMSCVISSELLFVVKKFWFGEMLCVLSMVFYKLISCVSNGLVVGVGIVCIMVGVGLWILVMLVSVWWLILLLVVIGKCLSMCSCDGIM